MYAQFKVLGCFSINASVLRGFYRFLAKIGVVANIRSVDKVRGQEYDCRSARNALARITTYVFSILSVV